MRARFMVPGAPAPWSVQTFIHAKKRVKPTNLKRYQRDIAAVAALHLRGQHFDCPLRLDIVAIFPRPKYMRQRYRDGRAKYDEGLIPYTPKPDRDNVTKAVQDSLKAWWVDDCRVTIGETQKYYAEIDRGPRTLVSLTDELVPPEQAIAGIGMLDLLRR